MKAKTKRQFQRAMLYLLIGIFVAGTLLLYLPFTRSSSQPQATPPPALNQIPDAQNGSGLDLPGGVTQQQTQQQAQPQPAGQPAQPPAAAVPTK